jgi:hypothetical protein
MPHCHHGWSWQRADAATRSARCGTEGSRRSLEPNLVVEAGSHSLGSSRPHSVRCECSPFYHPTHVTISLEIKLSIKANLSNGKGDNSIITESHGKLYPDRIVNTIFQFFVSLRPESGCCINRPNVEKFLSFPIVIYTP